MERVSLIQFPGVLKDPSDTTGLVAALGGEDAIRSATFLGDGENPDASLICQLRPGELSSRSNIGSVVTSARNSETSLFVLHVTTSPGANDADNSADSASTAKSLRAVIDSQVENVFSFPGIADFQYFSKHAIADVAHSLRRQASHRDSLWMRDGVRPSGAKSVPIVEAAVDGLMSPAASPWREKSCAEALAEAAWEFSKDARRHADGDEASDKAREKANRAKWLSDMRPCRWARSIIDEGATDPWFKDFAMSAFDETLPTTEDGSNLSENQGTWQPWTPENASLMPSVDATRVKVDGRTSSVRITSLAYRVDLNAETVPTASPFQAEPTFINTRRAIDVLRERFASRPVWSRRKLLSTACENTRRHFKTAVPHVAYAFTALTGPFQSLWIRYGYDPRKGMVENLWWQAIELRLPDAKAMAAIEKKFGTAPGRDDIDDIGNHSLAEMPSKRQLNLQLCDIVAPGLDALLKNPAHVRNDFDSVTGYLTAAGLRAVVSHLRTRVQGLVVETLGEANFQSLVEMQSEKEKSRKRARHNSNWDLIRKQTLQVVGPGPVSSNDSMRMPSAAGEVSPVEDPQVVAEKLAAELQAAGIDAIDEDVPSDGGAAVHGAAVPAICSEMARDQAEHEGSRAEVVVGSESYNADQDTDALGRSSSAMFTPNKNASANNGSNVIDVIGFGQVRDESGPVKDVQLGSSLGADGTQEIPVATETGPELHSATVANMPSANDDAEGASLDKASGPEPGDRSVDESDIEGFEIYDDDADMENESDCDDD